MRLDISLGPVQGFIAHSRRTRDLWASSYLLSFLSGHAMHGACAAGGIVTQPVVNDDPLYRWIQGNRSGEPPRIGTLPNHFVVEVDPKCDVRAVADAAKTAVYRAWNRLSRAVWERDVHRVSAGGRGTEQIWKRQVEGFWELVWTLDAAGDGGLLANRKHWRSHRIPDEPGDKCTVMPDWQELSGYIRSSSAKSRRSQDWFWQRLRQRVGPLDIRENERLCAIALIKRLFPKVGSLNEQGLGWTVDAAHWPSTVYISAIPWIRDAIEVAPTNARHFAAMVRKNGCHSLSERHSANECLGDELAGGFGGFRRLDANWFHSDRVIDERFCPIRDDAGENIRQQLAESLTVIYGARSESGRRLGPPPNFYALLLADGDRLGSLVAKRGGQSVGEALARFTNEVPTVVANHCGVTIYAGGDDVMAMLPIPKSLNCAEALAQAYLKAFETHTEATLSAAVLFAHVRSPLSTVLATAHRLLDDVAKDGNGRDSLAAAVLNPGGLSCQWVTTWSRVHTDDGESSAVRLLNELVGRLKSDASEPGLSSALIYRMRETLSRLCGWARWTPGSWGALPSGLDIRAFLHAEILHSLKVRIEDGAEVRAVALTELVRRLLRRSRSSYEGTDAEAVRREGTGARLSDGRDAEIGIDAFLLARFLATSGRERDL